MSNFQKDDAIYYTIDKVIYTETVTEAGKYPNEPYKIMYISIKYL